MPATWVWSSRGAFQPNQLVRFDAAASFGKWQYTNDPSGTYRPDENSPDVETYQFFVKDLKVGDAPQSQVAIAASLFPVSGASLQLVGKIFGNHHAEYDPFSRTDDPGAGERVAAWQPPGYQLFDLHASYNLANVLPIRDGGDLRLFVNVFNLFDEMYVQDAVDNSRFNGFDQDNDADDAEVFLGIPRSFNFGLQVRF